jgi:hypothetical protein
MGPAASTARKTYEGFMRLIARKLRIAGHASVYTGFFQDLRGAKASRATWPGAGCQLVMAYR